MNSMNPQLATKLISQGVNKEAPVHCGDLHELSGQSEKWNVPIRIAVLKGATDVNRDPWLWQSATPPRRRRCAWQV